MPEHPFRGKHAANARDPDEIPKSQGYCGVCGRIYEGGREIILATFKHSDGSWLSVCKKCHRYWKVADGTRAPRLEEIDERVPLDDRSVCADPPRQPEAVGEFGGFMVTDTPAGGAKGGSRRRPKIRG